MECELTPTNASLFADSVSTSTPSLAVTVSRKNASNASTTVFKREPLQIGNEVRLIMRMDGIDVPLHAQLPSRLAAELNLAPGHRTTVVMREEALHILDRRP